MRHLQECRAIRQSVVNENVIDEFSKMYADSFDTVKLTANA